LLTTSSVMIIFIAAGSEMEL